MSELMYTMNEDEYKEYQLLIKKFDKKVKEQVKYENAFPSEFGLMMILIGAVIGVLIMALGLYANGVCL